MSIKFFGLFNNTSVPLLVIGVLLISCGPAMQIYSDYDRDINFNQYETYMWAPMKEIESVNNPLYYNQLMDKRVKEAANIQLQNRNYREVEEKGDFVIHYHIVVEDKVSMETDPYGYYGPYWRRVNTNIYQHKEGTLIIDLMDNESGNLLWRGWAVSAFKSDQPEKMEAHIKEAVYLIFEKYPYKGHPIDNQSQP